jgi:putative ABC transport system permease protein
VEALASFVNLIPVTTAQGLIYALVALGVMVPFRLLAFPDLTSEGAVPLGGCLCAALLVGGVHPWVATALALAGGFAAGCATAQVHLRLGINTLLAGILVMSALYSVDLRILGQANVALFALPSVYGSVSPRILTSVGLQVAWFAAVIALVGGALLWFLGTEIGSALRAVGANPALAPALGIDVRRYTVAGLGLAGALSAGAGAFLAQLQGFADVNMGFGVLINGLAALVIGETLTGRETVLRQVLAPVAGSLVYFQAVSLGLALGLHPSDLKLATAAFVLLALGLPALRGRAGREVVRE